MTISLQRFSALSALAVVLVAGSALAAFDKAHASDPYVAVSWSSADAGTDFLLSAQATHDVFRNENVGSKVCGLGIDAAIAAGLPMPDEARKKCWSAVVACVRDAVQVRHNALSGVRFYSGRNPSYPAGTYRCLVR
jgi:hypothetical protein